MATTAPGATDCLTHGSPAWRGKKILLDGIKETALRDYITQAASLDQR